MEGEIIKFTLKFSLCRRSLSRKIKMQTRKLPIQGGAYKNVDEVSLTRNSPALIDGYPNEAGSTVKRPGFSLWLDLNVPQSPMDGLYWWDKQQCVIAVCNRRVYKISDPVNPVAVDITGTPMEQTGLTRIDDSGSSIYLANGKRITAYDVAVLISTPSMTGSGGDDLTVSGAPTAAKSYKVVIDGDAVEASFVISIRTFSVFLTNINDGDTITIDTTVYRFKTTMAAAYDVLIGATAESTLSNLVAAINAGVGEGVSYYTGTAAHPTFSAGEVDASSASQSLSTVTAISPGIAYNGKALATSTSSVIHFYDTSNAIINSTTGGSNGTFKWSDDGGVNYNATLVTITTAAQALSAGVSVTFASAGGHTLDDSWYFYTTQTSTYLLPNRNAPDEVSHVGIHDSYLICNKLNSGQFHYSEVGTTPVFRALNFATAESNPDDVVALHIAWREIVLFGRKSIETWFDDGQTPFSRLEGAFTERGCVAPYSVQFLDNTWMWLDNARRFSKMQGRTPVIVSTPYDKILQALTRVDDAYSEVIEVNGRTFYICTFPTDKFTVCYDWAMNEWTQWSRWNDVLAEREHFLGRCHAYSPDWGLHLIGDRTTSKIYAMDAQYFSDAGETISTIRRTGHVDWGTGRKKLCKGLRIKLLRGAGDEAGSIPKMVVRWRNDNGLWGQDHEVSLGAQGDNTFYGTLGHGRSLGTYRARQWEFQHTDNSSFILVEAEESFETLPQ